jgi:mannan endo-1,4-beta-mannosidase
MNVASDPSTMSKVTTTFQEASKNGLNLARTWAFNDGGYKALQISPGSYDEDVFKVLINIPFCSNLSVHIYYYYLFIYWVI